RCLYTGHLQDDFESPLHDTQGTDITSMGIEFVKDPFHDQHRNGHDQEQDYKDYNAYKTNHVSDLIFLSGNKEGRYGPAFNYTADIWKIQEKCSNDVRTNDVRIRNRRIISAVSV